MDTSSFSPQPSLESHLEIIPRRGTIQRARRDIALGLAAKDYRAFGTAMSPEEIADLKQASGGAITLSLCDITDEVSVEGWAREVRAKTEGGLNLLISNAGILTPGPLDLCSARNASARFANR